MKKMFTLFAALLSFSLLFAQYNKPDNRGWDDRNTPHNDHSVVSNNDLQNRPDRAVDMRGNNDRWPSDDHVKDRDSHIEIDRVNRDYDRRIDGYRNNRRMNRWEQDREINRLQREKAARLKNLGAGVLIGGILGVLIGSHL